MSNEKAEQLSKDFVAAMERKLQEKFDLVGSRYGRGQFQEAIYQVVLNHYVTSDEAPRINMLNAGDCRKVALFTANHINQYYRDRWVELQIRRIAVRLAEEEV